MCFKIDKKAKRPRQRIVWKIVAQAYDGYLHSYLYPKQIWQPDIRQARVPGIPTHISSFESPAHIRLSHSGIYVYLTKRAAQDDNRFLRLAMFFIMRVEVKADDWLFTSRDGLMATYQAATPTQHQPEFDWC